MTFMDYPRPNFRRPQWVSLNGEWEFGAGASETFDRKILVPFCPQSSLSGIGDASPGDASPMPDRDDCGQKGTRIFRSKVSDAPAPNSHSPLRLTHCGRLKLGRG